MWSLKVLPLMAMLHWTVGEIDYSVPGCAIRCWENTKYVSKCSGDIACQCSEPEYQNSVFQCLYSQCDTAHFGSALHHAITQCFGTGNEIFFAVPPIPKRDYLRRREAEYAAGVKLYVSGSAVGFPTESGYDYATQSANNYPTQSVNNYPTQSVNYPTQSADYPTQSVAGPISRSPPSPTPSYDPSLSSTAAVAKYNPVAESTNSGQQQLFTNSSQIFARRPPPFAFLMLLATLYLSI